MSAHLRHMRNDLLRRTGFTKFTEVFETDHALEPSVLLLAKGVTVDSEVCLETTLLSLHRKGGDVVLDDVVCFYLCVYHASL